MTTAPIFEKFTEDKVVGVIQFGTPPAKIIESHDLLE